MGKSRKEKVKSAIRGIRKFHELGRELPAKQRHRGSYKKKTMATQAKRRGMNIDILRAARKFASRQHGYTSGELHELCEFIERVQPSQDKKLSVFGKSHVIRLLSVEKKQTRKELQCLAINEGWSCASLERELAVRFGRRAAGGRPRYRPTGVVGLLSQIEGLCESWRRWMERVDSDEISDVEHAKLSDLSTGMRDQLQAANDTMVALHKTVTTAVKRARSRLAARPRG